MIPINLYALRYNGGMLLYDCIHLQADIADLSHQCALFNPDAIVAIARGGLMPAALLSYTLKVRRIETVSIESYDGPSRRNTLTLTDHTALEAFERILIVDDIVDSGRTMQQLLEHFAKRYPQAVIKTASLFYKPSALHRPDFTCKEASEWIDFFWERHA